MTRETIRQIEASIERMWPKVKDRGYASLVIAALAVSTFAMFVAFVVIVILNIWRLP